MKHDTIKILLIITIITVGTLKLITPVKSENPHFNINLRTRHSGFPQTTKERWLPNETAIIIIDMWDNHWCLAAKKRVDILAPKINDLISFGRIFGVKIIHSPGDVINYYNNYTQRKDAQELPSFKLKFNHNLPYVSSFSRGCDTNERSDCINDECWIKQHKAIEILSQDIITENITETNNYLKKYNIKYVLIAGVHTNLCVIDRAIGINNLRNIGYDPILIRDLTDSMYNPDNPPYVTHDEGTELIIEELENQGLKTVLSKDLLKIYD